MEHMQCDEVSDTSTVVDAKPEPIATTWTTGDFTLVSSDNFVFKTESCHLYSASSFFREGCNPSDKSAVRIEFLDETLETSLIIGHFLTLITTGQLDDKLGKAAHLDTEFGKSNRWEYDTAILYDLLTFLIKYDCPKEITNLLNHVAFLIASGRLFPLSGLVLASIVERPDFCAVYVAEGICWPRKAEDARTERKIGERCMTDPRAMPIAWWTRIPSDYLWCLTQAWDLHGQDDSTAVADEFLGLITALNSKRLLFSKPSPSPKK